MLATMDYKSLFFWILVCHLQNISAALNCYMCPPTGADTVDAANIECLALGWEISCSPLETHVEKGCTQSENCVGTSSCCQGQYCNGGEAIIYLDHVTRKPTFRDCDITDPMTSLTGYGQPCTDLSNCIQRSEVMRCAREVSGDVTKRCLCTDDSYRTGSTCKRKSFPDERCTITSHCSDVNTTCVSGLCLCADGMYANVSRCDLQVGLGDNCTVNKQCGGMNTQCAGENCACAYGYDVINGTDLCSGIPPQHPTSSHHIGTWTITLLLIAGINM